jgi:hypothetical protein
MGLFDRAKKTVKLPRRDPGEKFKDMGAREYEAKRNDRVAARLEAAGDRAGAEAARSRAAELRAPAA